MEYEIVCTEGKKTHTHILIIQWLQELFDWKLCLLPIYGKKEKKKKEGLRGVVLKNGNGYPVLKLSILYSDSAFECYLGMAHQNEVK